MLKICALALTAAFLAWILKNSSPEFAMLTILAAGIYIVLSLLPYIDNILNQISSMEMAAELDGLLSPVIKGSAIAALTYITANLCRDAGQSALAAKTEIAGNIAVFSLSLPLMKKVLEIVCDML